MKKNYLSQNFLVFSFFLVVCIACNLSTSNIKRGEILLVDDFSESDRGWEIWSKDGESAVSKVGDKLTMILQIPHTDIITTNHITYPNIEMTVDVAKDHGSTDNLIGFVCRHQDDQNYYGFLISSDGYYGIIKMKQGKSQLLSADNLQYSEVINQANEPNHLIAICDKEKLSFFVNSEELISVIDRDLTFGGNGLLIGSFEEPNDLVVSFDNFLLRAR